MSMFEINVKLANLTAPDKTDEVTLLVYIGATLSSIPRPVLERLGVKPFSRLPFSLADGRRLERDITAVLLIIDGRKAPVQVAFGEAGEPTRSWGHVSRGLGIYGRPGRRKTRCPRPSAVELL